MKQSSWAPHIALSFVLVGVALSCAEPAPKAPCLTDAPQVVSLPFQRLVNVFHEAESGTEIARFDFDPAAVGDATITVEPATPPYIEFNTNHPIGVQGHQLWAVRIEGLVGGAATDRLRIWRRRDLPYP